MSELLVIYHKDDLTRPVEIEREKFYAARRTDYQDWFVSVIDIMIFNNRGELLLQKRSRRKAKNPGRFHTSVGGHVNAGEVSRFTLIHECIEELGFPCYLVPEEMPFGDAWAKLWAYSDKLVIVQEQKNYFRELLNYS